MTGNNRTGKNRSGQVRMRRETMGNNRKWQEMTGNDLIVSIIDRLEKDRKQQEITGQVRTGKNRTGQVRK